MKFICADEKQLGQVSAHLLGLIQNASTAGATVVLLSGDLGSGKTTFTKNFAQHIGITDSVHSPTFIMQKRFDITSLNIKKISGVPFHNLYHFDMYRIEDITELQPLHFEETVADPNSIVFIEWPEKISQFDFSGAIRVNFSHIDPHTRAVEILV